MSFLDIALYLRAMVTLAPSDCLRNFSTITSFIDNKMKMTSFEMMIVRFAIVGPLIAGDQNRNIVELILNGISTSTTFFSNLLEYLAVQFMISKKPATAERSSAITKVFTECIRRRPGYYEIVATIRKSCPSVVSKFLVLDQYETQASVSVNDIMEKVAKQQSERPPVYHPLIPNRPVNDIAAVPVPPGGDQMNETSNELNRLLEAIKRRRVQ
jgi:hypothetical protein